MFTIVIKLASTMYVYSQFKSNQTRSNQSVAPSVRNTTDPEHAPDISSILTRTNHQICPKSLRNVSVQIKPDQIKSKRRSLGLKYNRPRARTGHILNIDSDKSPNLSKVIKECLFSNQTRPDQIQLGSIGKTKVYVNTSKYQSINSMS
jgi:hypothetical protein